MTEAESKELRLGIGQNLPYIWWALGHRDQLPALLDGAAEIKLAIESKDIKAGWTAVKALGDIVISIIDDFPGFNKATGTVKLALNENTTDEQVDLLLQAEVLKADGTLINRIVDLMPVILQLIRLFSGLFPA